MGTSSTWRLAKRRTTPIGTLCRWTRVHRGSWWVVGCAAAAVALTWLSARVIAGGAPAPADVTPGCADVARSVAPGETLDILTQCSEEDADYRVLTLSIVTPPTQGSASVVDYGHVRYIADPGASGNDSFTMRATDPSGVMSAPATISITLAPNQSPSCSNINFYGVDRYVGTTCVDPDGDFLTAVTIVIPPAQGTLVAEVSPGFDYSHSGDVSFFYTPFATASGSDSFSYTVTDQKGATSLPANGTISFANRPPQASGGSATLLPGETRMLVVCYSDPDHDVLTATLVTPPGKGIAIIEPPGVRARVSYTANAGAVGSDSFTARCDDGHGGVSGIATFTIQINAVNSPPACYSESRLVDAGSFVDVYGSCSDPDSQPTTRAIASAPSKGTVGFIGTPGLSTMRYTANPGATGTDSFTFTGTDTLGATSAPATVNVTIVDCTPRTRRFRHATQIWYGSAFQGATRLRDGVQLSDFITGGVRSYLLADATLDARIPAAIAADLYPWVNPLGLTNIEWVLETPQNLPAEANLRAELAVGLHAPAFDSAINAGSRSFLIDYFEIQEPCGTGLTHAVPVDFFVDVSLFELNAHATNRAPTCSNRAGNVNAGAAVDVAPACDDADSDPLTYLIGAQGTKGTASIAGGQLHYVANAGTSGTDTFTYTANDGYGGVSAPATVTITIAGTSTCQYGTQGCTTGYWKSNAQKYGASAWPTPYAPTTKLNGVFSVPACVGAALGNATLQDALSFSSGKTLTLAAQNLLRQGTGAVLNASNACVQYGACKDEVLSRVNAALASCDRTRITNLATELEGLNSQNCPLDAKGLCLLRR